MKKYLSFFFALCASLTSMAQGWERPVPKATEFATDDTLYVYNVKAGAYFLGNNDWGTRASIKSTQGFKCVFQKFIFEEDEEWDEESYVWRDSIEANDAGTPNGLGRVDYVFLEDLDKIWVDELTSDPNLLKDHAWTITRLENGNYQIGLSSLNGTYNSAIYPDCYVGSIAGMSDNRLYICDPFMYEEYADGFQTEWIFVTPEEYEQNIAAMKIYNVAMQLREAIEEAKANYDGIDVSAQEAVFNNTGSSIEQLTLAIEGVRKAVLEWKSTIASPDQPVDMTEAIVNADYSSNNDGWSGTAPTAVSHSCMEQYSKAYNTYQDIKGLADGIYVLSVDGHFRTTFAEGDWASYISGNESVRKASLYAIAAGDSVYSHILPTATGATEGGLNGGQEEVLVDPEHNLYVPNSMYATSLYTQAGKYSDSKLYIPLEGGDMRVGVAKDGYVDGDWTIIDNWHLTYYGNSFEAYRFWLDDILKNATPYDDDTACTKSLLQGYNALLAKAASLQTKAEIKQFASDIQTLDEELKASIQAYAAYKTELDNCREYMSDPAKGGLLNPDSEVVSNFLDYLSSATYDIYEARLFSAEEIMAEQQKMNEMLQDAIKSGMQKGTDVTNMLVNPGFEYRDGRGWEYTPGINISGGLSDYPCAEAYSMKFDCHQDVTGLQDGLYKVTVNAFYRPRGNGGYDGSEVIPAVVYLNDFNTPVQHIMADHSDVQLWDQDFADYQTNEGWVPNGMNGASTYFREGHYLQEVYGLVEGGKMRIGIRCDENANDANWCLWTNFRLIYMEKDLDAIHSVIESFSMRADELLGEPMGKSELKALQDALAKAKNGKGEDELFTALINLNKALNDAKASVDAYRQIEQKLDELATNIELYQGIASEKNEEIANSLYEEVEDGYIRGEWTINDVSEKLELMNMACAALRIPAYEDASDDNPIDMTSVIINPLYDQDNNQGWDGTKPTNVAFMCCEMFNCKYDYSQTLLGLPAGTYALRLQAFYRAGFAEDDYATLQSKPDQNNNAILYASTANRSVCSPIVRASAEAQEYSMGGAESEVAESLFIPNNMEAASYYFDSELYNNELILKLNEGETLTIGVKKDVTIPSDWTIFRNWSLHYFGSESQQVETAISDIVVPEKQEPTLRNLQGQKVSSNYKGIVISNGRKWFK